MKVQLLMLSDDEDNLAPVEIVDLEARPHNRDVIRTRDRWFTVKAVVQMHADTVVHSAFTPCQMFALVEDSGPQDSALLSALLIPDIKVEEAA